MKLRLKNFFCFLFLVAALSISSRAADFLVHDGDRVVFLGDSITEQRLYTTYIEAYALTPYDAEILTRTPAIAGQFEEAAKAAKNPKRVANLVQSELAGRLKAKDLDLEQSPITARVEPVAG